jgi:hypothetical protein
MRGCRRRRNTSFRADAQQAEEAFTNHRADTDWDLGTISPVQESTDSGEVQAVNDEAVADLDTVVPLHAAVEQREGALAVLVELGKELVAFVASGWKITVNDRADSKE